MSISSGSKNLRVLLLMGRIRGMVLTESAL